MSLEQIDILWIVISTALVLLMQAGFCCLESGLVQPKNTINVAIKNFADFCFSSIAYLIFGFAIMFGPSYDGIFGTNFFYLNNIESGSEIAFFLFQVCFCGTAATIISGAVAERTQLKGYLILTCIVSAVLYPIFGHWAWGGMFLSDQMGWLEAMGFRDFAGSAVVHTLGGVFALAAILIIGSREGRYTEKFMSRTRTNLPMTTLGVFLLWVGWIGFNGGSSLRFNDGIPLILVNTLFAATAGSVSGFTISRMTIGKFDIESGLNGSLCGLVSITACCNVVSIQESLCIGGIAGVLCFYSSRLLDKWRIDDAVGAVPVHAIGGIFGTISVALFGDIEQLNTGLSFSEQIWVQSLGASVCVVWAFCVGFPILWLVNQLIPLRVTYQDEMIGLNNVEHGIVDKESGRVNTEEEIVLKGNDTSNEKVYHSYLHGVINFMFNRPLLVVTMILSCGAFVIVLNFSNLAERLVVSSSIEEAKRVIGVITSVRSVYTSEIVEKGNLDSVTFVHHYENKKNTLPLPATLTHKISENLTTESQTIVTLYSDIPVHGKTDTLDRFQQNALKHLRENPTIPYYQFISDPLYDGGRILRFATADIMKQSCISCHNSYVKNSQEEWKIGDVRGVLEVQFPVTRESVIMRGGLIGTFVVLGILFFIAICVIGIILKRLRATNKIKELLNKTEKQAQLLHTQAEKVQSANHLLQEEIDERKRVEEALIKTNATLAKTKEELLDSAHRAGMADVATEVLHNVGNLLTSAYVSTDLIKKKLLDSKVDGLSKASELLKKHQSDLHTFFTTDPKGSSFLKYLFTLDEMLHYENKSLLKETDRVEYMLKAIADVIKEQQQYAIKSDIVKAVDIRDIVEEALDIQSDNLHDEQISIIKKMDEVPLLHIPKVKLLQVILNVTKNAIEAMKNTSPKDKSISYFIAQNNNESFIKITDTGCGIAADVKKKIFTFGYSNKVDGHGFGLHSCANMMNEMGGSITLSDTDHEGTTFLLKFPHTLALKNV